MQLAAALLALFLIPATILTLFSLYYILVRWNEIVKGFPAIGGALSNLSGYLAGRNAELIGNVAGIVHAVISWSVDAIAAGLKALFDLWNTGPTAQLYNVITQFAGLKAFVAGWVTDQINGLLAGLATLNAYVNGFVTLNIQAFDFWKTQTTGLLQTVILPNLASLTVSMTAVTSALIPQLQATVAAINETLLQLINGVVKPMRQELTDLHESTAIALNDPRVGVIPRVGSIEKELAPVLPWVAAIGITIPVAANLAKLGRNPCWCTTDGPLSDQGLYELAALQDLI